MGDEAGEPSARALLGEPPSPQARGFESFPPIGEVVTCARFRGGNGGMSPASVGDDFDL